MMRTSKCAPPSALSVEELSWTGVPRVPSLMPLLHWGKRPPTTAILFELTRASPALKGAGHSFMLRASAMKPSSFPAFAICGLDELIGHQGRGVTHILSILDPEWPEPGAFQAYDPHLRA